MPGQPVAVDQGPPEAEPAAAQRDGCNGITHPQRAQRRRLRLRIIAGHRDPPRRARTDTKQAAGLDYLIGKVDANSKLTAGPLTLLADDFDVRLLPLAFARPPVLALPPRLAAAALALKEDPPSYLAVVSWRSTKAALGLWRDLKSAGMPG